MQARAGLLGPPGARPLDVGCGRKCSAARADIAWRQHSARFAEQVCVPARSALGPGSVGHRRRGAALSSIFPHLAQERSERTHATFIGSLSARRDPKGRCPQRFSSTLFLLFPLCGKNWGDRKRRRPGESRTPVHSVRSQPYSLLPHCLPLFVYFSFLYPLPLPSRVRSGAERQDVASEHRGRTSTGIFPLPRQGGGAGGRTPDYSGQTGLRPIPMATALCTLEVRRASGSGPRPRASAGADARTPRKRLGLNGKRELFLCVPTPRAPATSGLLRALAAQGYPGLDSCRDSWSERRTGHPLEWLHHRGRPRQGGPYGSSPPKFVVP
jgi:hypothetical protein